MLVLVTDAQGRTWRATVDEGASVEDVPLLGPSVPTYGGETLKRGNLLDALRNGSVAQGS